MILLSRHYYFKRNIIIEMMMIVMMRMIDDHDDDGISGDRMWEMNELNISSFIQYTCKKIWVYYTIYITNKEVTWK